MKERYSIGETAQLLGVSKQTLRYYDKMDILKPCYQDENTGYRYYSYKQFHYIDRIKYLQQFDISLEEIKEILKKGDVDELVSILEKQRKKIHDEIRDKLDKLDDIQWYIDYFNFLNKNNAGEKLYKVWLDKRYAIAVDHIKGEVPIAKMEFNLARVKGLDELKNLHYLRQYAYLVDYNELVNYSHDLLTRTYWADKYFIYLKEKPDIDTKYLIELPEGEYLCYRARMLTKEWNSEILREFFKGKEKPKIVIANEFEENLKEYLDTMYLIQILL